MSEDEDWRSEAAYAYIENLQPRELPWEFLRRNPDYQKDFARIVEATSRDAIAIAERWGLCFRLRP